MNPEPQIFINYRREDSANAAGRVHDRLAQVFGRANVFMDTQGIPRGVDFESHINNHLSEADLCLVMIGRDWLRYRLDASNDYVASEIVTALKRKLPLIPVLVDGATMPPADMLPKPLLSLVRYNAADLRHNSFDRDVDALIADIKMIDNDRKILYNKREAERLRQRVEEYRSRQPTKSDILNVFIGIGALSFIVYEAIKMASKYNLFSY